MKTGAAGAPMENFSTLSKGATAILRDIEALSKTVKDKDAAQGVRQDGVVHL